MEVDYALEIYYDAHLFKFDPDSKIQCLYNDEVKSRDFQDLTKNFDEDLVRDWKSNKYIFSSANNRFAAYDQNKIQLVKGFELTSKYKLPRMCSY
jgi:uncharacterized secreted protein with C-terminal beta-propeller domain